MKKLKIWWLNYQLSGFFISKSSFWLPARLRGYVMMTTKRNFIWASESTPNFSDQLALFGMDE